MTAKQSNIEITRVIDERPLSSLQILVIVLCSVNVFLDGYDIQSISLALPSLVTEWGVPREQFSWVMSAAIFGGILGGAFLTPLGDRFGRRQILVWSTVTSSIGTFLTATASSPYQLIMYRLIMGFGMGASVAIAITLTSEYMPAARRARLITIMYCNVALGALTAGFVAPVLINQWGWRGIFVIGGIMPLILSIVLFLFLPESVRFLMERNPDDPRIKSIIKKMAPDIEPSHVYAEARTANTKLAVSTLLTPLYRNRTLLTWAIFFLNYYLLYFLISWLPQLLTEQGWSQAQALRGGVLIQAGGIIGGLTLALLVDRGKTVRGLLCAYLITTVAFGLFLVLPATFIQWGLLVLIVGCGTSGAQFAMNALAAILYPPGIRATGLGWATAIGRSGAAIGPMTILGLSMLGLNLETYVILGLLSLPVLLCAALVLFIPRVAKNTEIKLSKDSGKTVSTQRN